MADLSLTADELAQEIYADPNGPCTQCYARVAELVRRLKAAEGERDKYVKATDQQARRTQDWIRYHGAMQVRAEAAEARAAKCEAALVGAAGGS